MDPLLDGFFSTITNLHHNTVFQYIIAPLGLFLWWWWARKLLFSILLTVAAVVAVCDSVGYRIIKEYTFRERPFSNSQLAAHVRVGYKPQSSSFPSNHALNTFAVATLLTWYYPHLWALFFFIAGLVGYSRIYVGVHYPSDVVVGAIVGILIATLMIRWIFDKFLPLKPVYRMKTKRGQYVPSERLKKFKALDL